MSKQFIETTFCGFTAKEVMEMKSRIDELEAELHSINVNCQGWIKKSNSQKEQLALAIDALENYADGGYTTPFCAEKALTRIKHLQEVENHETIKTTQDIC